MQIKVRAVSEDPVYTKKKPRQEIIENQVNNRIKAAAEKGAVNKITYQNIPPPLTARQRNAIKKRRR